MKKKYWSIDVSDNPHCNVLWDELTTGANGEMI